MMRMLRHLVVIWALALVPAAFTYVALSDTAAAQQSSGPDYDKWEATAQRAGDAIDASRASTSAMEDLRDQLVEWRDIFTAAQNVNSNSIATAQAQLKALGPVPEEGSESPEIARQREELSDRVSRLTAPVKAAQLAYSRADGMIKGIDRIIRERQAEKLLELGPSPLNPKHWPAGVEAATSTFDSVRSEVQAAWRNDIQRVETKRDLPKIILLTLLGCVLLIRGRFWVELAVRLAMPQRATSAHWIISLLMSLGEIIVPFIGLLLITQAAYSSGLVGLRGDLLLNALKPTFVIFLLARWLSLRCFPRLETYRLPLSLDADDRRSGRLYGGALGLVVAVFFFINQIGKIVGWSEAAVNVVLFPVLVVAGLLLLRLARLLSKHSRNAGTNENTDTYRNRLTRLLANALTALAVVAPALAAVGYFQAATSLMLPSLLSLILLAAILVVQRVISEVFTLVSGNREGAADELIPVLLSFGIVLLSAPMFALIWGARVADLSELWMQFTKGITLGEMTISPTIFLTLAVIFTVGMILTRLLQGTLKNTLLPKTRLDAGGRNAIVSGVGYIGIFLAALIAVTSAGIDLSSLAIVAGALSVGIGFGLQNIVSNFVSGIILLIERPISQGDWIEVNGQHGTVREISVRSTRIETFDRSDLIIPNADLVSGTVTNYTRGNTVGRVIVPVGVAYGTDTKKVEGILKEIAMANPMVIINPEPSVVFKNFGADALDFEIRAILRDVNWVLSVKSDMNHEIAKRFAEEGIEIPYAQRDIWLRNPEVLAQAAMGGASQATKAEDEAPAEKPKRKRRKPAPSQRVEDPDGGPDGDGR
ncbi:DUF3772 domain-containing protein [Roseovarius pelagicus]|uniref:DUF3772 domain-containing protein n=1 Tax=Roseovarius pelagicus TaxID=2980108 RepID=A0ABY6DAL4_9RHOB|nr:DUF3772 domain-containing protein [Roseovarius pelagicus]UXX83152.1 DUF3772 domain-containing protein [Roseovarius pelagicus]